MTKITLVTVKNPFDVSERDIKQVPYLPGEPMYTYTIGALAMALPETDLVVSRNGHVVEDRQLKTVCPEPGDFIAICPVVGKGGKQIMAIVASAALAFLTNGAGDLFAHAGKWTLGSYLAAGATMYLGGQLLNHLFPPPAMDLSSLDSGTKQSYSWSTLQNMQGQGNSVPITYGTVKTAGQVLAQYIDGKDDQQYLNILLCGGEGPIDTIDNVCINGNPIGNYRDIQQESRLGTNDQTPIANFADTYVDQELSYQLTTNDWAIQSTEGDGGQGLRIVVEFPNGLYYCNDQGGLDSTSVQIEAQYRKEGETNWVSWPTGEWKIDNHSDMISTVSAGSQAAAAETWTITCIAAQQGNEYVPFTTSAIFTVVGSVHGVQPDAQLNVPYSNGYVNFTIGANNPTIVNVGDTLTVNIGQAPYWTITAGTNTAVRRTFRLDHLPAARYQVRCQCVSKPPDTTRYCSTVYWTTLSHIMYDDFARPGKVLLGIRALATDQLSGGVPTITWTQTRSTVWVWDPGVPGYVAKPATNPAWACYDLIHRCRTLTNIATGAVEPVVSGVAATQIDYQAFQDWAEFCDEPVNGEPRCAVNLLIDSPSDLWSTLQKIEGVGRGKIIFKGTRYSCVCDKPSSPVQMFTMGNIVKDTFTEEFLALKDRANAVDITFLNRDKDYGQDTLTVYGDGWDDSTMVQNPTQISLYGITSFTQAYREAKYRLNLNKYLIRTVSFDADVDAISCQVGDVILLQHDVPAWGEGGRLVAADANTVTLDHQVVLEAGVSYAVAIRLSDDTLVEKQVVAVTERTETDILRLTEPFGVIPGPYDIYSFGEVNKVNKPFRITSITRSGDLRRKLSGIEYIPEVYLENDVIPQINYSADLTGFIEVSQISCAQETYRQKDGTIVSLLHCSWDQPKRQGVRYYRVSYCCDADTWVQWTETTTCFTTIPNMKAGATYTVRVSTINDAGVVSPGIISAPVLITGKDDPPSDVTGLTAVIQTNDSTKVLLAWDAVTDVDLRGYELCVGDQVVATNITDTNYLFTATVSKTYQFTVRAVDNSGNRSQVPAVISQNVTIEPAAVDRFTATIQDTDRSRLMFTWQANHEQDISYYEIRRGQDWDTAALIATQLKATSFSYTLTEEKYETFLIKAVNVAGHASLMPASQSLQIILKPDTPTNFAATQDCKDRSQLILSWNASPGKDIAGYEIRSGTSWDTGQTVAETRELSYRYSLLASGAYSLMIRAKTVAGMLSNVANTLTTCYIQPDDVTGFAAQQSATDRTEVTLSWNRPTELDVSYYEIRNGATWDSGQIIGARVTGTFFVVRITDETEQIFWIKAVSVAGKYSQNPASVEGIYNMNPNPVTNIQMSQDPNDKSVVVITWNGVGEADLDCYELRYGYVWDSAQKIGETKEEQWSFRPPATGDIKIMIKARTVGGYYSDEAFAHYDALLEPAVVTGFGVLQNGEEVELWWDKHPEPDVVAYEIREGASFDSGQLIVTGLTVNEYKLKVDTERNYYYHIKAINRSLRYSLAAAHAMIAVEALPPKNIITSYDEIALQTGTSSQVLFGESNINWQTIGGCWSDYPTTKFSDVGGSVVLKLAQRADGSYYATGTYCCQRKDMGQVVTANISTDFRSSVVLRGVGTAILQIRTSTDGSTWTPWQDFRPAQYTFRYLDAQVLLATADSTKTPEVNHLTINVDVPDFDSYGSVTVPVGGLSVNYGHHYYTVPVVTPTAIGDNKFPTVTAKTNANFTVKIVDRSGTDIGGQLDWRARGY